MLISAFHDNLYDKPSIYYYYYQFFFICARNITLTLSFNYAFLNLCSRAPFGFYIVKLHTVYLHKLML